DYYGIADGSQEAIFERWKAAERRGTGNLMMATDSLVKDARERGFRSGWARVNFRADEDSLGMIGVFVNELRMPVIVCQKFTEEQPRIGHFRIVLDLGDGQVTLHDPSPHVGGAALQW